MKKLLFVVSGAKFFLSHRLTLAQAAKNAGYKVHVATPPSEFIQNIREAGLIYHPIMMDRGGLNPIKDIASLISLYRLYRKIKPTIVHHVTVKPILYGGLAARLARVPGVVHALTGLGYIFISESRAIARLRGLIQRAYRIAFRHKNLRAIFQNEEDQGQFISRKIVDPKNCILIAGSGVCMSTFTPSEEALETPLVILASRLLWDKGVAEFVEAARILKKKNIPSRFALIGEGDEANPASIPKQQLEAWSAEGVVEWWGERFDVPEIMKQAHVVCLPSYREGLPRVLVEAAASARAIITTDTPGCRDVVRHGENGLLVKPRNSEELASAMEVLINDVELRKKMGSRGREMVEEKYSLTRIIDQTLRVYEDLEYTART